MTVTMLPLLWSMLGLLWAILRDRATQGYVKFIRGILGLFKGDLRVCKHVRLSLGCVRDPQGYFKTINIMEQV